MKWNIFLKVIIEGNYRSMNNYFPIFKKYSNFSIDPSLCHLCTHNNHCSKSNFKDVKNRCIICGFYHYYHYYQYYHYYHYSNVQKLLPVWRISQKISIYDHIAAERLSFLQGGWVRGGAKKIGLLAEERKNVKGKTRTNSLFSTTLKKFLSSKV